MRTMFGFEIGKPAYPGPAFGDDWKQMVLRKDNENNIIQKLKDIADGVIVWETFKQVE